MINRCARFIFSCLTVFSIFLLEISLAQQGIKVRAENQCTQISNFNDADFSPPLFPFHDDALQGDFDIFYDRCEWHVDPAIDSIQGVVTTYFKVLTNSLDTISLDLSASLIVDSIKCH